MAQENIPQQEIQTQQFDLKILIFDYLRHWYWFAISLVVSLFIAFLYLRYATPQYEVVSKVLIKDEKKGGGTLDPAAAFQDLDIFKSNQNINNEIEVLRGRTLMYRVLKELHLETTFYTEGNIKTTEIYGKNVPINITLTSLDSTALGNRIKIQIKNQNNYILTDENGESEHAFGKQVRTSYATFTLTAPGEI